MLDAKKSGESSRVSTTDSCVSISLNDSWTGRKLLESIGYDYNLYMTSEEFNVRIYEEFSIEKMKQQLFFSSLNR